MRIKVLFIIAILGVAFGFLSILIYRENIKTQAPVGVSYNPYKSGIYATGIVESYQANGSDINIFPEVSGRVTQIFVKDGQTIKKDTPILAIDDSVQREIVARDFSQISYAKASLRNVQQQLDKIQKSYQLDPKSISKNTLDNAVNAVVIADENLKVSINQFKSDKALLDKYIIRATVDGMIFRVVAATGSYISPQGSYDTYTQGFIPTVQMGIVTPYLQVRCYLDEILVPRLPLPNKMHATMFIRGLQNRSVPLEYVSTQPFTIPNIELSDQRNERVDVRVLPIIFRFKRPTDINVFPGQLVDIYIRENQ